MSGEDFLILSTDSNVALVEDCMAKGLTPDQVALKTRNPLIATQIKYLYRARNKMPDYFAARCLIDKRGFEQCSSQATAESKCEGLQGALAIDLTAGLGVDSYALSKRFARVIAIEADQDRARLTTHNFGLLGASNIEVVCAKAEDFLANCADDFVADMIYVDPSRVEQGGEKRVYSIVDSSPNVLQLMDRMRKIARQVVVKLSPLFDVDECFRLFGPDASVEVVSLGGECKEVLVSVGGARSAAIANTIIRGSDKRQYSFDARRDAAVDVCDFEPLYLCVPDVAFVKSRTVCNYMRAEYPSIRFDAQGYLLCDALPAGFEGQCFRIERMMAYQPRAIIEVLRERGIKGATIGLCRFPYSMDQVERELKIKSSGSSRLYFSIFRSRPTMFFVAVASRIN